jgi:hypothetical protein
MKEAKPCKYPKVFSAETYYLITGANIPASSQIN